MNPPAAETRTAASTTVPRSLLGVFERSPTPGPSQRQHRYKNEDMRNRFVARLSSAMRATADPSESNLNVVSIVGRGGYGIGLHAARPTAPNAMAAKIPTTNKAATLLVIVPPGPRNDIVSR